MDHANALGGLVEVERVVEVIEAGLVLVLAVDERLRWDPDGGLRVLQDEVVGLNKFTVLILVDVDVLKVADHVQERVEDPSEPTLILMLLLVVIFEKHFVVLLFHFNFWVQLWF